MKTTHARITNAMNPRMPSVTLASGHVTPSSRKSGRILSIPVSLSIAVHDPARALNGEAGCPVGRCAHQSQHVGQNLLSVALRYFEHHLVVHVQDRTSGPAPVGQRLDLHD